MSKAAQTQALINALNHGHPGSIYSANQAGAPEAFARFQAADKELQEHRLVMGKTREGMSGHFGVTPAIFKASPSRATGLLAGLMRRI